MSPEKKKDFFNKARKLETDPDTGAAAERAAIKKEADRLMKESRSFEKSRSKWQAGLMKAALVVAGISVTLNIVLGAAVAMLTPLKTVEPYVLSVDQRMGTVEVLQPLENPQPSYGEATDKYYIEQYIRARESYDWGLIQRYFDTVKSFSVLNSGAWNDYDLFLKSEQSPLVVLSDRSRVLVDISSVTLDERSSTATVRMSKSVVGRDGRRADGIPETHWIATVRYEYPNPKLLPSERRLNPLGMKISSYQIVQEQIRGQR